MEMKRYQKEENFSPEKIAKLREHYKAILELLGEDPAREGLLKTPERVAKAMSFLTQGYEDDPLAIIRSATFKEEYRQMVLVKDIELYSLCEHHMLPFYGKAHVAYIPNGYITGLSKIARVVESFARRLQVQERLTVQIRDCIQEALNPMGVAVVIEASHMCRQMRGVEKQGSATTTSAFTGVFLSHPPTRQEFMTLISNKYRSKNYGRPLATACNPIEKRPTIGRFLFLRLLLHQTSLGAQRPEFLPKGEAELQMRRRSANKRPRIRRCNRRIRVYIERYDCLYFSPGGEGMAEFRTSGVRTAPTGRSRH